MRFIRAKGRQRREKALGKLLSRQTEEGEGIR